MMATAKLNIELTESIQYPSLINDENFKDSEISIKAMNNGLTITFKAEDPKVLLSSIGSTIRKLRVIESVSEVSKVDKKAK
jgi:tRNA threonylcarbamoyladenosine modification (KEOPS) complex  Pcc1 subunit